MNGTLVIRDRTLASRHTFLNLQLYIEWDGTYELAHVLPYIKMMNNMRSQVIDPFYRDKVEENKLLCALILRFQIELTHQRPVTDENYGNEPHYKIYN